MAGAGSAISLKMGRCTVVAAFLALFIAGAECVVVRPLHKAPSASFVSDAAVNAVQRRAWHVRSCLNYPQTAYSHTSRPPCILNARRHVDFAVPEGVDHDQRCLTAAQNTKGVGSATTIAQILSQHNKLRAKYRAPALKWNTTLAASSQVTTYIMRMCICLRTEVG